MTLIVIGVILVIITIIIIIIIMTQKNHVINWTKEGRKEHKRRT